MAAQLARWADLNDDGFADLFATNRTYCSRGQQVGDSNRNFVLVNEGNEHAWLRVRLQGTKSNPNAYGARVRLFAGELVQTRELSSSQGYNSGEDPRLLFGLGDLKQADRLEVTWPSGCVQVLESPQLRTTVTLVEPG